MNRRTFLQTSSAAATAVSLIPGTLLQAAESKHVNWPVGCFNRPWNEKKNFGLDAALDGMKAAGYKIAGLLRRDAKDPLTGSDATKEYLESLKKRIAARGLTVNMAALRDKHDLPLDDQIKDMRKQIENAAFIGAKFGLTFGVDSPKHYDNYCKLMQDAAPFAQDHGVKLVLKPHGGATSAADEISQFMEKVNHPNFKIWFDAGNIIFYTGKDPVTELKPIVQHVTGFCAKDCDGQKGSVALEFGTGKVDFPAVFRELKKGGFNGPLMVECVAPADTPELATANARKNREFLEKVLKEI